MDLYRTNSYREEQARTRPTTPVQTTSPTKYAPRSSSPSPSLSSASSMPSTPPRRQSSSGEGGGRSGASGGGARRPSTSPSRPVDRSLPGAEVVLEGDQLSCVGLQLPRFPRWLADTHRYTTKISVPFSYLFIYFRKKGRNSRTLLSTLSRV